MACRLSVQPNPALIDEKLYVQIKDLDPGETVTLRTRMSDAGHRFYGYAYYNANAVGEVNLDMESKGGTYCGKVYVVWENQLFYD